MWNASWGLSHWETNNIKNHIVYYEEVFFAKMWNSLHLSGKKLSYIHLKGFLKYKCELYLKQPLTPPQRKIIVAYRIVNHNLTIENWTVVDYPYI